MGAPSMGPVLQSEYQGIGIGAALTTVGRIEFRIHFRATARDGGAVQSVQHRADIGFGNRGCR